MAHENHIAGFAVSTLVHLGAVFFALAGMTAYHPSTERRQPVPLTLAMFQPPPEPVVESVVEPVAEPVTEPVAEPVAEPEPPKPVIEEIQVRQEEKPQPIEPRPRPVQKPVPETPVKKPEVARKPSAEPKPPPLPEVKTAVAESSEAIPLQPVEDLALIRRIEHEYRARLQAAIEANKTYPRRARRLRQQGSVVVAFEVKKNGSIMNLEVASPSDSEILDTAALKTVQKVSGLFPLPDELNRTEWRFTIPINYYLR
jgi:protein TonB